MCISKCQKLVPFLTWPLLSFEARESDLMSAHQLDVLEVADINSRIRGKLENLRCKMSVNRQGQLMTQIRAASMQNTEEKCWDAMPVFSIWPRALLLVNLLVEITLYRQTIPGYNADFNNSFRLIHLVYPAYTKLASLLISNFISALLLKQA